MHPNCHDEKIYNKTVSTNAAGGVSFDMTRVTVPELKK